VGYPHEAILEAAREVDASLIVASTHGRSGLSRWMYGSTAGHLLHTSHIPLLVIGKQVTPPPSSGYAPKHVLVPLDGSKLAEAALPAAREVVEAFAAKVSLLRVAPFSAEAYPMMVPQMYWPELDKDLVAGAQSYLEKVRANLAIPADVHVLQGPRSESILSFVEGNPVDLVAMATHARAGVQRAVLGSTADRMLDGPAPVLLVRPTSP
jgi:nucleotide-binding universal stress UspA family protein